MLQAVMTSPGQIMYRQVPKPDVKHGEILVHMRRMGICGSDIHVFHGKHPYTSYPIVQGHEVSGEIAELGPGVTGFNIGDLVTIMPQVTCGECYPCRHGLYHICDNLKVMGFQTDGSAQEYFPVAAEKIIKIPEGISVDEAAMVEPLAVAVHAVRRFGNIRDKKVVVLGCGTIGNLTAQASQALGASTVLVTDINDFKLEKARLCGLPHTVNTSAEDLAQAIKDIIGPDKADVMFECVGVQPTITQAINLARKGSHIIIVGVFGQKPVVDLGLVQDRELTVAGTLMYQKDDYLTAIELISKRAVHLQPMISAHFPFTQTLEAYHAIENAQGNILKVMINLDQTNAE